MSKLKVLHRFLREPNHLSTKRSRIGNRSNPLENTLTKLTDPKTGRELFLIGTTNSSTLLANRTKNLVGEVKPDSLYVQTTPDWWKLAKNMDISTQSEFNLVSDFMPKTTKYIPNNPRGVLAKIRMTLWMFTVKTLMNLPHDFTPFTPGLEVKYAVQEAEKAGSEIYFAGTELNKSTLEGLNTHYLNFLSPLYKFWKLYQPSQVFGLKNMDMQDFWSTLRVRGGEAFAESIDRSRANMMVHILNTWVPEQKHILIDIKDESMFLDINRLKGKKIVALVNQWHVEGIQQRWRSATGTEEAVEERNPVGDMDIDRGNEEKLINDYLKRRASQVGKTEPATDSDYQVQYHKDLWEPERNRHTHHQSYKDVLEHNSHGHGSGNGQHGHGNDSHAQSGKGHAGNKH